MSSNAALVEADVVILGGGIQGVWLLADLVDHKYQALLLEREHAGSGQTGHSHVFLHRGHMHAAMKVRDSPDAAVERVKVFRDASARWYQELDNGRLKGVQPLKSSFYVGFQELLRAKEFRLLCAKAGLDCEVASVTSFVGRPHMFEAKSMCLESKVLLDCLLGQNGLRGRTGHCDEVQIQTDASKTFRVTVRKGSLSYEIVCGALVLAAGAGNEPLISEVLPAGGIRLDPSRTRQQTVKTYMLAVKGPKTDLIPVCGMFPDPVGVFIAHRLDSDGAVVWLIADRQRHNVSVPGHWTTLDARQWFSKIKPELQYLTPWLLQDPHRYRWGIYEAAKAEAWTPVDKPKGGISLPQKHTVFKDPERNVWVTWPAFLTLAPVVASEISAQIQANLQPSSAASSTIPAGWSSVAPPIRAGRDKWCTTPLLDWDVFSHCYVY